MNESEARHCRSGDFWGSILYRRGFGLVVRLLWEGNIGSKKGCKLDSKSSIVEIPR